MIVVGLPYLILYLSHTHTPFSLIHNNNSNTERSNLFLSQAELSQSHCLLPPGINIHYSHNIVYYIIHTLPVSCSFSLVHLLPPLLLEPTYKLLNDLIVLFQSISSPYVTHTIILLFLSLRFTYTHHLRTFSTVCIILLISSLARLRVSSLKLRELIFLNSSCFDVELEG